MVCKCCGSSSSSGSSGTPCDPLDFTTLYPTGIPGGSGGSGSVGSGSGDGGVPDAHWTGSFNIVFESPGGTCWPGTPTLPPWTPPSQQGVRWLAPDLKCDKSYPCGVFTASLTFTVDANARTNWFTAHIAVDNNLIKVELDGKDLGVSCSDLVECWRCHDCYTPAQFYAGTGTHTIKITWNNADPGQTSFPSGCTSQQTGYLVWFSCGGSSSSSSSGSGSADCNQFLDPAYDELNIDLDLSNAGACDCWTGPYSGTLVRDSGLQWSGNIEICPGDGNVQSITFTFTLCAGTGGSTLSWENSDCTCSGSNIDPDSGSTNFDAGSFAYQYANPTTTDGCPSSCCGGGTGSAHFIIDIETQ